MSNANIKADTSGFLTDIEITTDSGTATFTGTGSILGGGDTITSASGGTITVNTVAAPPSYGYRSGYWDNASIAMPFLSLGALPIAPDVLVVNMFYVREANTFDRVSFEVTTASAAGGEARLGLYNLSGTPTTVQTTLGTVLTDTTGFKTITISESLSSGWYGVALHSQLGFSARSTNSAFCTDLFPVPANTDNLPVECYTYTGQTYASGLPDLTALTPTLPGTSGSPIIMLRSA